MIGLHVEERDAGEVPSVTGAPIGVSGWPIRTQRGPSDKAYLVTSINQLKELFFAEVTTGFPMYYVLRGLFNNAKPNGARVYVKRVVGPAVPQAATVTGVGVFPLAFTTGQTLVVNVNAAGDVTLTISGTRATVVGAAGTFTPVTAGHVLKLLVDGSPITVTFAGTENNIATFLVPIQAAIMAVGDATDVGGEVQLRSSRVGSTSEISVLATSDADVLAQLGFPPTGVAAVGSGNLPDLNNVMPAHFRTLMLASFPLLADAGGTGPGSANPFLQTTLTGPTASIQVNVTSTGNGSTGFPTTLQPGQNLPASSASRSSPSISPVWQFNAGYMGQDDVGTWADGKLFTQVLAATDGDPTHRNLKVFYQSATDTAPVQVEPTWQNLTADNVVSTINHPSRGSKWIKVLAVGAPGAVPAIEVAALALTGGFEGGALDASTLKSSFAALNGLPIQIVAAPDLTSDPHAANLETYATGNGKVIALHQAALGVSDGGVTSSGGTLRRLKSFMAGYRGAAIVDDELGGTITIPILGHVVGAGFIKKVQSRGGFPHIAPAGAAATLVDLIGIDDGVYDQARLQLVNDAGYNPVIYQQGIGVYPKTSRTFSTQSKWYSIHVRVQANFFKQSFLLSYTEVEQEGNNADTRRKLQKSLKDFGEKQYNDGGLDDANGIEGAFAAVCDLTNNDSAVRGARRLRASFTYYPVEIAEDVEISITRVSDAIVATER